MTTDIFVDTVISIPMLAAIWFGFDWNRQRKRADKAEAALTKIEATISDADQTLIEYRG